ncbi:MAG: hypothetical protein ABI165_15890 [Bryobacteraceae bacterium]
MPDGLSSAALSADVFSSPAMVHSAAGRKADTPEHIRQAASQFEALMIGQMLQSVREAGSGDFTGTSDDQSGSSLLEMAEQQFAQALSARGGLGLAKMVTDGLTAKR